LFAAKHVFEDEERIYTKLSAEGDTLEASQYRDELRLSPPLFPMHLKEGIGANAVLYKSFPFTFNLRVGYGARQSYYQKSYKLDDTARTLTQMKKSNVTGLELVPLVEANLTGSIRFTSDSDILLPSTDVNSWVFDSENRLRFRLTQYVSVDFVIEVWKEEAIKETQFREQILLRFSHVL